MHGCLQITEILANIFDSYDDDKRSRNTLLHLALVCKIFQEPALDALWRFQWSLLTLVKTFPRDLWDETVDPETLSFPGGLWAKRKKPMTLTFKRSLTPLDWSRFQFYARRMKKLSLAQSMQLRMLSNSYELSPSVLSAIESSLGLGHCHRPLLRNLRELAYYVNEISLHDACMFLGPRLTNLFLSIPTSPIGLGTFLTAVKSTCPSLSSLRIHENGSEKGSEVGRAVSNLIYGLLCLEETFLLGVTLDCKALGFLSSLPILRKLHVSLPTLRTSRDDFACLPFPALRVFRGCVASITDAREFFQLISSSSSMEHLYIDVSIIPPSQELYTFLTTVHQSSFHDKLTTVSLRDSEEVNEHVPSHSLDAHTLSPLFQCPNLEDVSFSIRYGLEAIDNSLMKDMALAWPRLRTLRLMSFYNASRWHSNVNLEGLIHLAQHCRALESVSHEFDVSLPATWIHPGNGIRNESSTYLHVGRSRITDPVVVVAVLSDVFPNLRLSHRWHPREAPTWDVTEDVNDPVFIEMSERWEQVDKLLEIKQQERLSAPEQSEDVRI